jgi:hypothetical protein
VKVPGFIARQFYVAGSLRNTETGFELQAQNPMGSGVLVGVGQLRVDGRDIDPASVTAQRAGDPQPMSARDVSQANPVTVNKGDRVTLHVTGEPLSRGEHELEVSLAELNLGELTLAISDTVAG